MSAKKATAPAKPANAAATPSPAKPAKADEPVDADAGDDEEEVQKGAAGQANKDMANVAGFGAEEGSSKVDSKKLGQAMTAITDGKATATARKARERELEKVVVAKEDLELVMNELDLPKAQADRLLREAKGSTATVLRNALSVA